METKRVEGNVDHTANQLVTTDENCTVKSVIGIHFAFSIHFVHFGNVDFSIINGGKNNDEKNRDIDSENKLTPSFTADLNNTICCC